LLVLQRPASAHDRLAQRMFALWWSSAAAVILLSASPTILSLFGTPSIALIVAINYVLAAPLAAGLCGLLYFLLYVYTGRRGAILPLAVAYAAFFAFEVWYFAQFAGRHLETTPWQVRTVSDVQPPVLLRAFFGALVALPALVAAVGYGALLRRVHAPEQRYRVLMISAAFVVWFAPLLAAYVAGLDQVAWFPLVYQVPGLVAAGLIVAAYRPPSWLRSDEPQNVQTAR
jgi:hypothetical protein